MFQKIINGFKRFVSNLTREEKRALLTSVGMVLIGFIIYYFWQARLPQEPDEEPSEEVEEVEEDEEEKETTLKSEYGYEIKDISSEIQKIEEIKLFGEPKSSNFKVNYKGVKHGVFENPESLSLKEWIKKEIEKQSSKDSYSKQKEDLSIKVISDTQTPLGGAKKIVRLNSHQSEELLISKEDHILTFYYQAKSVSEISNLKNHRETLLKSIQY